MPRDRQLSSRRTTSIRTVLLCVVALSPLLTHADAPNANAVIRPAPIAKVTMQGRLGVRHQRDLNYVIGQYDNKLAMMMDPYRLNNCDGNWNGEYAGKWLDAASLMVANTGNAALQSRLLSFVQQFRGYQDADGYFGCNAAKGGRWDVWNQWCSIYGLLGYYEQFGDTACLSGALRAAKSIVRYWSPITGSSALFFTDNDDQAGGLHTGVLGELLSVYEYTGDTTLLNFARAGLTFSPILTEMRSTNKARVMHCYPLQSTWGGAVKLATITQNQSEFAWMLSAWNDMIDRHQYPVGGFGCNEILSATSPNNTAGVNQMETCATMEWMILNMRLYRATGDIRYPHALEKTLYNILLCEQNEDGTKWQYYTPMRYDKSLPGPTSCCYWSGPRAMAMLPGLIYAYDKDGVRVDFLETSTLAASFNGVDFTVAQNADFPAQGSSRITVTSATPVTMTMKIRIPTWARNPTVSVNGGSAVAGVVAGQYASIQRTWSNGDYVDVRFDVPVIRGLFHDYAQSPALADLNGYVVRGAEVMALDSRDNPSLNLDIVTLPDTVTLVPTTPDNGRLRYTGTVQVGGRPTAVTFTPFGDAGTNNVRYRTVFPANIDFSELPLKLYGTPIVSVPNPGGAGSRNLDIIRDDRYPDPQTGYFSDAFDTFTGAVRTSDYFGYTFGEAHTFKDVTFTFGMINDVGGPFETVAVQVRSNGQWVDVGKLTAAPAYASATVTPFSSYKFSFASTSGDGIRVIGQPRGKFVGCSELDVSAVAAATAGNPGMRGNARGPGGHPGILVYDLTGRLVSQSVGSDRGAIRDGWGRRCSRIPYVVVTRSSEGTVKTVIRTDLGGNVSSR